MGSEEINRNGGHQQYRANLADQAAWDRAHRPKTCKLAQNPALAKNVDMSVLGDMDEACWFDPALEQCAAIEISLPRDTGVMAYLLQTYGSAREGARDLDILVEEANNIVNLINQELMTH